MPAPQVKQYTVNAIIGIVLAAGALALVITHSSYECTETTGDQSYDCVQTMLSYDVCDGAKTASYESYNMDIDLTCPWSTYITVISYLSLALALIFFFIAVSGQTAKPLPFFIAIVSGLLAGLLLLVTWISMIVYTVQGSGGDFIYVNYTNGWSVSEGVFIGNTILVFVTFDWVFYTMKSMPQSKPNPRAQQSNRTNLLPKPVTQVASTQANKAPPK